METSFEHSSSSYDSSYNSEKLKVGENNCRNKKNKYNTDGTSTNNARQYISEDVIVRLEHDLSI